FFQAEDGIRDRNVTGVQTCALPIYLAGESAESSEPGNEPAGIDELETAVESTAAAVDAAQEAVDTAREALERSRTDRDEARVAAVRAQPTHEQATTTAQNLHEHLAADRESDSDESLDERVTEAKAQAQEREEAVASARARYQASDPETLEMRLQNARGLLESKQKQQESDRQEVDRLAALIDDRAGEGIYDKLKDAEETLESLRSRLTRLRRQADAIGLLRET